MKNDFRTVLFLVPCKTGRMLRALLVCFVVACCYICFFSVCFIIFRCFTLGCTLFVCRQHFANRILIRDEKGLKDTSMQPRSKYGVVGWAPDTFGNSVQTCRCDCKTFLKCRFAFLQMYLLL